jgi:predicted nucleic acid-binding Zn ribbon protein
MPNYLYKNPNTGEIIEIFQKMEEEHVYIDTDGVQWEREWSSPNTSVDTKINPWSASDFTRKTGEKKGTLGDLWDQSKELSRERARSCGGVDPVRKKYEKEWSKKRNGMKLKE